MMTWFEQCKEFAAKESIHPRWVACLASFGKSQGIHPTRAPSFTGLETTLRQAWRQIPSRTQKALCQEVDAPQAALFVRRLCTVHSLLEDLSAQYPAGRLLRVGLLCRIIEILEGSAGLPRALRVRAAVDFFYSQGALLHHQSQISGDPVRPWSRGLQGLVFTPIRDGVSWTCLEAQTPLGPQRIHLIRAQESSLTLQAVDRRSQVLEGLTLADEALVRQSPVAISGGFFLYSEPDIEAPAQRGDPVGLLMNAGKLISPPVFNRTALAFTSAGKFQIQPQGLAGCRFQFMGKIIQILAVNSIEQISKDLVAFSRAWGPVAPPGLQCSVVGQTVLHASKRTPLAIPLSGYVLHFPETSTVLPRPGTALQLQLPKSRKDWVSAIAGGPLLVADGRPCLDLSAEDFRGTAPPRTFSEDETGDQNLLPRMAIGLDPQGSLIIAAADGRDFHHALGLTLGAVSELMIGLGCHRAMNLDGGSSKRMVVDYETVDQSSTEVQDGTEAAHQRPVRSALFFSPR